MPSSCVAQPILPIGASLCLEQCFNETQWRTIERLVELIASKPAKLEHIKKGRGELKEKAFSLHLYRFIIRENGQSFVKECSYTQTLLSIFAESQLMTQLSQIAKRPLQLLRLQLNIMQQGGFVECHTDAASDSAYLLSGLIQVNSDYEGGAFVLYDHEHKGHSIKRTNRSLLVMSSKSAHQVNPVIAGKRYTICLFCG